jgi:5'-3' exonuclease
MTRLHVVDGTYELFRAHFSKRPAHLTPEGQDAKATAGMAASLLGLLHDEGEAVTHLAVAFDNPIRSFRNDLFDGYKTEAGVPPELLAQFDLAEDAVRALGVTVWSMRAHEADDALASAAARFGAQVTQVRIVATDKDLMQCVRGSAVVLVDRMRERVIDEDEVKTRKGVPPGAIPDLLALVGDEADGIPGLAGFGEKTAALLLRHFGTLETIPDDASRWPAAVRGAAKLAATLAQGRDAARLYKRLATLVTDADVGPSLEALAFRGVPRERWERFCTRLGLSSLASRPRRWAP